MVLAVRFALTLATLSTSCLCWLGYASEMRERLFLNRAHIVVVNLSFWKLAAKTHCVGLAGVAAFASHPDH